MKNSIYDTGTEATLIEKLIPIPPLVKNPMPFWSIYGKKNLPYHRQCRQYFAISSYINYEDIIQECFLTFLDVIRTYDPVRGKLTTALFRPLRILLSTM